MVAADVVMFAIGAGLLIFGAELLVRGASRLALATGMSPLVVGLTVIAFGTSAPEFAVTIGAAYAGQAEMALGNVVGSNIFNVLFILGLSAIVVPLVVAQEIVRRDVPLMIVASLLVVVLGLDGRLGRVDGVVLALGIVAYTVHVLRQGRRRPAQVVEDDASGPVGPVAGRRKWIRDVALVVAGLVLLALGAKWLVEAASAIAAALGVSDLVIGLTVVAAGTSLPEVAASLLAAVRGERDMAVGNIVGSNLFNLLAVLGLGGIVAPAGIPVSAGVLTFDLPVMVAVAVAALPLFFTGYAISRWEGIVFVGYYAAYVAWLIREATDHPARSEFAEAMVWFVLPLTVLTLGVVAARELRHHRRQRN